MKAPFRRVARVPAEVIARAGLDRSDKVLAHATTVEGTWLLGTRETLVILGPDRSAEPETVRIPWENVETADWDRDAERIRVAEVGEFGRPRPTHEFAVAEPSRLLQLIRERVTASVLLQRRVDVRGRQGLTVVARRSPHRGGEIVWACEYDPGVDPDDPVVRLAAEQGLRAAADEVGAGPAPI